MIIEIPGEPEPQARMKFTRIGGFGRAYDPKAKQKDLIRHILRSKAVLQDLKHPKISFIFYMPIPSGISKKKRQEFLTERVKHIKRPDVDNLVKLYLDCLDGIVFERDEHVSLGLCVKVYSSTPRTVIVINESSPHLTDRELQEVGLDNYAPAGEISSFQCESYAPFPLIPSQCESISPRDCKAPS